MRRILMLSLLLVIALVSCDNLFGPQEPPESLEPQEWHVEPTYPGENNRGVFYASDFYIGQGVAATSAITKTLLTDSTPHPQLSHGPVYAMRATLNNNFHTSILIPITNDSWSLPAVYAKAENIRVRDVNGRTLYSTSGAYVYGSVGNYNVLDAVGQTDAYLAPRETGYIPLGFFEDWHTVHSIEFSLSFSTTASVGQPAARVRPTALKVTQDGNDQSMQVSFRNTGSTAAILADNAPFFYVLSDVDGVPIAWGFFSEDIEPPDGRLEVDAYGNAMKPRLFLDGAARFVELRIGFEDDEATLRYAGVSSMATDATLVKQWRADLGADRSLMSDRMASH